MKLHFLFTVILFTAVLQSPEAQDNPAPGVKISPKGRHPLVSNIVAGISRDSLTSHIRSLVSLGTRFQYAENRRQVAGFIAAKFRSFGYPDVVLDSFKIVGQAVPADSVWQYNVIATWKGASSPDEIYLLSAHHDDYAGAESREAAPGANDNGSGVATVLEIARVLKAKGFRPASTIRFITWAAEEMTIRLKTSGSILYANRIARNKEDIRLIVCNDMVANTSDTAFLTAGSYIKGPFSWAGELMTTSSALYSKLQVAAKDEPVSDNARFHELGFPSTGFMEYRITPYYHTKYDSLSHCNMDLCLEVTKASCAILLNEQLTPVPQHPFTTGRKGFVLVSWKRTGNQNVKGFNIYRSALPGSAFRKIATTDAYLNSYKDTSAIPGIDYQYFVTSRDGHLYESIPSVKVDGACSP